VDDTAHLARIAALVGDPARARMLTALMDGRALTATELALEGSVAPSTASSHLARLLAGELVAIERQGRHRYYRLSGPDVAEVLEGLMGLAVRVGGRRVRVGPKEPALRSARVCYDHLAGERGVAMLKGAQLQGFIDDNHDLALTGKGRTFFADFGIDLAALEKGRRPVCRACLDWSERHSHLGGALGAAILNRLIEKQWVRRDAGRLLTFTREGAEGFDAAFGPA